MEVRKRTQSSCDRRRFLKLATGGLALMSAAGVGGGLSACSKREPELRVASNVWPGYEMFYLARAKGYFEKTPIRMVEMPSATVIIQALIASNVEAACLTLDEVILAKTEGIDLTVVAILDFSMGGDVLIAKPDIKTLADLKGRRIGVEQSAVGAIMLSAALDKAGLTASDIEAVHMNVNWHKDAFLQNKVDALVTFEPVPSQLTADKQAVALFDSSMIPGSIVDVLAVRPDAIDKSPNALKAAINGHFMARQAYLDNPKEESAVLAKRLQIPPGDVPVTYKGLELVDIATNKQWLKGANSKLQRSAQALAKVMAKSQLLPSIPNLEGITDDRFLPN